MVTPIGLNNIGGNFFWIWGIICFSFVPITWFFGVETSGRTLEQVDRMFFDEPRLCMGLNPNHRKVIKYSREDEENRYAAFADLNEKEGGRIRAGSIAEIERRLSVGSIGSADKA